MDALKALGWIDPAKRDNESLLEVTEQLHARAGMYGTKGQHDAWQACRTELLRRLNTPAAQIAAPGDVEQFEQAWNDSLALLAPASESAARYLWDAALRSQGQAVALTTTDIERGWRDTFSVTNPYCPCDLKSFTKAVRWATAALAQQANKETQ